MHTDVTMTAAATGHTAHIRHHNRILELFLFVSFVFDSMEADTKGQMKQAGHQHQHQLCMYIFIIHHMILIMHFGAHLLTTTDADTNAQHCTILIIIIIILYAIVIIDHYIIFAFA